MTGHRWLLFALGSAFFAALTTLAGKLGVETLPSNVAVLLRTVVILLMTAAIVIARSEWPAREQFTRTALLWIAVSAVATGLSWLCFYRALALAPASKVGPVDKLSVVMVVALAALLLGEAVTWRMAAGAVLITLGVIAIAWRD